MTFLLGPGPGLLTVEKTVNFWFGGCKTNATKHDLVGGFNPFEKY